MTAIVFKEKGFRRLTSPKYLSDVLEYVNGAEMELDITIDLHGCIFSYPLSKIFEAVVRNLDQQHGNKTIKIIHGYSVATKNHFVIYLTKNTTLFEDNVTTVDNLKKNLKKKYHIELTIIGPNNE